MPNSTPKTHFYFGKSLSGKTHSVREAVKTLLQSKPGMTYTVLGDDEFNQYRFDEGYEQKPYKIRVNKTSLEVITEADIIIVPETRELHDLFIVMAASQTGKHVFSEAVTPSRESAIAMLTRFNKRNAMILENELDMAEETMRARKPFTFSVNYEETTDDIPLLREFNPDNGTFVFHHCEIPTAAMKKPTGFVHTGLKNVDFKAGGIKAIFGGKPENFTNIFENLLDKLIVDGTYSTYAVLYDSPLVFHPQSKKNKFSTKHAKKRKPVLTYFAPPNKEDEYDDREFITAKTDADVIIIPWLYNDSMMHFLRVAVATGKPVLVGINASNTHNAKALTDLLEYQSDFMGWMLDEVSNQTTVVATNEQAVKSEKRISESIVNFGRCTPDENGVSSVSWYSMDGLALLNG